MTRTEPRALVEWELVRLSHAFAHHIDHGEFEEMIALFTPDGVFDRAGLVHHGHDELRAAMAERPKVVTRHVLSNFHFPRIDADEAEGRIYCMSYHSFDGAGAPDAWPVVYATASGRLLEFWDTYRRTEDGWRIASRVAKPILVPEVWP